MIPDESNALRHFLPLVQKLLEISPTTQLRVKCLGISHTTLSRRVRILINDILSGDTEAPSLNLSESNMRRLLNQRIGELPAESVVTFTPPTVESSLDWTFDRDMFKARVDKARQHKYLTDKTKWINVQPCLPATPIEILGISRYHTNPTDMLSLTLDEDVFRAILLLKDRGYTTDTIIRLPFPDNFTLAQLELIKQPFNSVAIIEDHGELLII